MQQGHPGIHEKENTLQGSLSVRLSLLPRQSGADLPYCSKVEQWPTINFREEALRTKAGQVMSPSTEKGPPMLDKDKDSPDWEDWEEQSAALAESLC